VPGQTHQNSFNLLQNDRNSIKKTAKKIKELTQRTQETLKTPLKTNSLLIFFASPASSAPLELNLLALLLCSDLAFKNIILHFAQNFSTIICYQYFTSSRIIHCTHHPCRFHSVYNISRAVIANF
jgi:hypothetical protein